MTARLRYLLDAARLCRAARMFLPLDDQLVDALRC